ncbi:hypothetical protein [Pseudoduganella violaceinigra]|uniref:hypothetical protein n=1 Tax=Pseudoduganella violaceinigra TaxID=246602 RepID=UPI000489F060|nr:hypothetical protein [Pseudoduganella violaceinigra]
MTHLENSEIFFGPSPKKGILLLAISCAFVAIGFFMRRDQPMMGWFVMCFFGLGVPVSLAMLLPGLTYLKLDHAGFEICSLGRRHKTAWCDIRDLQLVSVHGNQMVGFNYVATYSRFKAGRAVASALSGVEGAVQNQFRVSTKELLEVMKAWHARYCHPAN